MAAGYADDLLGRVSGLVAACTRRVSRATRRLLRRHGGRAVSGGQRKKTRPAVAAALCARGATIEKRGGGGGGDAAPALWSRRILMGERCQPLDFAGAIHYDSFGMRMVRPPTPRSASTLSCRSSDSIPASDASDDLENDVV